MAGVLRWIAVLLTVVIVLTAEPLEDNVFLTFCVNWFPFIK